jgi:quinoprotein glucose dehydrogenase
MRFQDLLLLAVTLPLAAQTGTQNGEWRYYGGDDHNTRYAPLDQIHEQNVGQLQVVWRWKSTNFGPTPQATSEVTPLMVGGRLYFTAGTRRTVVAADAATGETIWTHRIDEEGRGAVRQNNRGVAYWADGQGNERIIGVTPGYQLYALDAKTGQRISSFGSNGLVDLWIGLDRDGRIRPGTIGLTSAPIVVRDVIVVGMASGVGVALPTLDNPPGYIRGYDVRTGRLVWTFHTVPKAGEPGVETWGEDHRGIQSWTYTGNTGAWGPLAADEELGIVYVPTEAPSGDLYGGQRPGDNLYSDCVLALDARTGRKLWHYQVLHHDVWDWDLPAGPVLLEVTQNGRRINALAQVSKQAFTYVFNRETGEPLWPIIERPVPQSDVPFEKTSPTQPFPTKPAPFDYQGYSEDLLADFTPEIKAEALKIVERYKLGPIFTPPIVRGAGGKEGTWQLPGAGGGANWQGASADPETGYLYIPSTTSAYISSLQSDPARSEMPYIGAGGLGGIPQPGGVPLIKPPYGRITAIDLNTGDHVWMTPYGTPPNNPRLRELGLDLTKLGGGDRSPLLVTKTLLIGGGNRLRFLDKKTGRLIHEMDLGGAVTGGPMTYLVNGRQFIVATVAGGANGHEFVAVALPPPPAAAKPKPAAAKAQPAN